MDLYVVTEEATGYCVGAFTTERKAQAAGAIRILDGYPCRIQQIVCNNVMEVTSDEPQDES